MRKTNYFEIVLKNSKQKVKIKKDNHQVKMSLN